MDAFLPCYFAAGCFSNSRRVSNFGAALKVGAVELVKLRQRLRS
jgi:hypothetical protein